MADFDIRALGALEESVRALTREVMALRPLITEHAVVSKEVLALRADVSALQTVVDSHAKAKTFLAGALVAAGFGGGSIGAIIVKLFSGAGP